MTGLFYGYAPLTHQSTLIVFGVLCTAIFQIFSRLRQKEMKTLWEFLRHDFSTILCLTFWILHIKKGLPFKYYYQYASNTFLTYREAKDNWLHFPTHVIKNSCSNIESNQDLSKYHVLEFREIEQQKIIFLIFPFFSNLLWAFGKH